MDGILLGKALYFSTSCNVSVGLVEPVKYEGSMSLHGPAHHAAVTSAAAARATYEAEGVVRLRGAFPREQIEGLAVRMEEMVSAAGRGELDLITTSRPGRIEIYNAVRREPLVREFIFRSAVAAIAGIISGSTAVRFYFDVTFGKIGDGGQHIPGEATTWHHDVASFGFKGRQMPSLWLALTDVPEDAGPLVFAQGSHLPGDRLFRASGVHYSAPIEGYFDHSAIAPFVRARGLPIRVMPAEAGDLIVIHPYVLHGSRPVTRKGGLRLGFCTRWLGDDVAWRPSPYTLAEARNCRSHLAEGAAPPDAAFPVVWRRV